MPELPPPQLVALLEHLGLATAAQVARLGKRVRRLARDLPQFESVWVDALAQARVLTSFQAAEINAGRGPLLRVGPYVLCERLPEPYYVSCFRAKHIESQETVRLIVIEHDSLQGDAIFHALESLAKRTNAADGWISAPNASDSISPQNPEVAALACVAHVGRESVGGDVIAREGVGSNGQRIFAASPWVNGRTASEWMVHHGRIPPQVVLEIARAMLRELGALHRQSICHGDVSVSSLILGDDGRVTLAMPGVRGILRPTEGYAHDDLLPEAYDSLSPERVALGTPPTVASDLYACGCVWWHLLCGRSPLVGGSGLSKLRAAQAGEICDVRRYAPDVPAALAGVLVSCLQHEPARRPSSVSQVAAMLGSPTRTGQEALADCLAKTGRPSVPWTTTVRSIRQSNRTPLWIAGAACSLVTLVALIWPLMHRGPSHGERPEMASSTNAANMTNRANATNGNSSKSGLAGNAKASRNQQNPAQQMQQTRAGGVNSPSMDPSMQTSTGRQSAQYDNASPAQEESPAPNADRVVTTSYQQSAASPKDLVLSGNGPLYLETLSIQPGQRVRGPAGRRVQLVVPRDGLKVDQERVCFENIDFLWKSDSAAEPQPTKNGRPNPPNDRETPNNRATSSPALVRLMASQAAFHGCSFQTIGKSSSTPVAIDWVHPNPADHEEMSLPSGRIQIMDCVFSRVAAGLACHRIGVLGLEVTNSLCTRCGPFMQLDRWPKADESVSVALLQTTMRQSGPIFACQTSDDAYQPGPVIIQSTACIFAPANGEALLQLSSSGSPESVQSVLNALRWTGQGSLVTPNTPIAIWTRAADGKKRSLDEASLSIAGLVRSEVGFAGQESQDPASSRAVQWQAPLQTPEAPGIDPSPLPAMLGGL